jgi:hypothetical protein
MGSKEGSRSPFSKQPTAGSPKLRIYENLFLLNQGMDHVIALLRGLQKFSFADKTSVQCAIVKIEVARCDINADFTEHLAASERRDEGRFSKQRRHFEKRWHDPDDVYLDVRQREEERKKQGLPLRLGVLPDSAVEKLQRASDIAERATDRPPKRGKWPLQERP